MARTWPPLVCWLLLCSFCSSLRVSWRTEGDQLLVEYECPLLLELHEGNTVALQRGWYADVATWTCSEDTCPCKGNFSVPLADFKPVCVVAVEVRSVAVNEGNAPVFDRSQVALTGVDWCKEDQFSNPLHKFFFTRMDGLIIDKWFHYLDVYHFHFQRFRGRPNLRVLEIGVQNGGSLEMWRQYFGEGLQLVGVDVDPRCARHHNPDKNTTMFIGDQGDLSFLQELKDKTPEGFDIIIDDGGHRMHQQLNSFRILFPHVKSDGVYLVEDTHTSYSTWLNIETLREPGTFMAFARNMPDVVNTWNTRGVYTPENHWPDELLLAGRGVFGAHFYDSVVVFDRGHSLSLTPTHSLSLPTTILRPHTPLAPPLTTLQRPSGHPPLDHHPPHHVQVDNLPTAQSAKLGEVWMETDKDHAADYVAKIQAVARDKTPTVMSKEQRTQAIDMLQRMLADVQSVTVSQNNKEEL